MEHGYLVQKEVIEPSDESQWGYPDYIHIWPVAICETQDDAEKLIEKLKQDAADAFMDWLDENEIWIKDGQLDVTDYWTDDDSDECNYYVEEVPYYDQKKVASS